jgi:peptidoglycan/LPS O-acetylase OafA/YrhL
MQRILGLDGLRAIAVSLVVAAHLNVLSSLQASGIITVGTQEIADVGVHLFFCMSGFLITKKLIGEHFSTGRVDLYNFFFNRALRIIPVYLLVVTLTLVAEIVGDARSDAWSFLGAYTFTSNFLPRSNYSPVLGHTWSLAVEEHFYVVWPFLFTLFYTDKRRRLFKVVVAFTLLTILLRGILSLTDLNEKMFIYRWSITAGGSIGFGCIVAMLLSFDQFEVRNVSGRFIGSIVAVIIALALIFHSMVHQIPIAWSIPVRALGAALLVGWIYLNQHSFIVRMLDLRPFRYIGVISYGIYMWQGFFLSTGPARTPDQTWPPDQMTGLFLLVLVAPLSYHFLEKPILARKRRLTLA